MRLHNLFKTENCTSSGQSIINNMAAPYIDCFGFLTQKAEISSRLLPLVSGNNRHTKIAVIIHTAAYKAKIPNSDPNIFSDRFDSKGKAWLTITVELQRTTDATDMAIPRSLVGKISAMISHAKGARLML